MEKYFATGEVNGRLANRIELQKDENGEVFARFDLLNRFMDDSRPCACVAHGVIAEAMATLTDRGTRVAVRGEISPFRCVLPTGKSIVQGNTLHVTTFRVLDEPEALPVV